ncbi:MAG TPA: exodeoxyribonuclease III [Alphaproteobacteria bacterium]|nr:exodeoxyribonuclease III [Alphaproteobacteria bacterium]
MVKIATWNVNSVKARLQLVLGWLKEAKPDVCLLQEIKCQTDAFPALEIEELGYNLAVVGQKSYNGVAILSRAPIEDIRKSLPGHDGDEQARYVEGVTAFGDLVVRVASIYLPNGNPVDTEKFSYKLAWLERLRDHASELLKLEEPVILAGDYNVIPGEDDVYNPKAWVNDALFRPESRAAFRRIVNLGYTEAFRTLHPNEIHKYTFWDYQAGAWQKDQGLRIDHLLLSPQAADRLVACEIDRDERARERASDHVPIWVELKS